MGTQPNPAPKVVFGPFEYDDLSGDLSKYGTHIRLQGKPLQVLSFLVNRPGQIISRDELQRHLWEGTTFGDFEQGLNSAVNKLRQTLGDSADRSEEHTSELQSLAYLVCRLLLEKKKKNRT